ncbi:TPA: S4 domain-containing protein YaaA, partial [Enterococcus faecium]|nr:S4 domain-containing protein YaaA [Enterococcus faecium]
MFYCEKKGIIEYTFNNENEGWAL